MAQCRLCRRESHLISRGLGVCLECLRRRPHRAEPLTAEKHAEVRQQWAHPPRPPDDPQGLQCNLCANSCRVPPGGVGYCGLRRNLEGRWQGVSAQRGAVSWHHDHLPTNCVADWVCAGGSSAGYPRYSVSRGPEFGHRNLAVFFHGCSFNCLFCQNWRHRDGLAQGQVRTPEELAAAVDPDTTCICYFGGDPSPQMPFALRASELARQRTRERVLRICWETNGSAAPPLLERAVELSLQTGGTVKFDLKAWDPKLHRALCGTDNQRTLENFERAAGRAGERPDPPLVVASTLLVPGYIDVDEVRNIARFIARLDPHIPYALLAFYPQFTMTDLPTTSRDHALRAARAATEAGLTRVHIGNLHLLGPSYP